MKLIRYIGKNTAAKLINSKAGTFLLVFLAISWSYDRPYLALIQEQNQPITWCIFPFFLASVRLWLSTLRESYTQIRMCLLCSTIICTR